jgi:hypothetical protein
MGFKLIKRKKTKKERKRNGFEFIEIGILSNKFRSLSALAKQEFSY